ncbi:NADH dehydrogenase [ubiquinone] 1 alpha subcomplex subunit 2 [Macrosteles quadrilineatus]|uniref:NADH dehydrogenase [ubiquinone] 1 alpha subcomplex subunit 2 n=1 Tax=Macrosteles quadrilineatus TaxID=74068 RepID=UPI0023E143E3|nr:NADH dehydrogenase [ubiquinone] 1 alpha subcomplex subunit 2 [Macrosteles quadrilineatus]
MAGRAVKFGSALKELRIHLCQTSDASKGVRDFVEKFYVPLKQMNPKFPILIRECSGVQPRAWARYGHGKETSVSLTNLQAENVLKEIEKLASKN